MPTTRSSSHPGFGLGLRAEHYQAVLEEKPPVDWFEIHTEDYLQCRGAPLDYVEHIRSHWPIAMHGVSLSIGSSTDLDDHYLKQLKDLIHHLEPLWVSDHLCWTGVDGTHLHNLLPLPFNEQVAQHVIQRVNRVQNYLKQRILLENLSSCINYTQSDMHEWEFLSYVAEQADCFILLDLNNVCVSAYNHGFSPEHYITSLPQQRVREFHIAGCLSNDFVYQVDTHDAPVSEQVWSLYAQAVKHFGHQHVPTLLERDDKIPPLSELVAELNRARTISATIESSG